MKPLVRPDKNIATFQILLEVNHIPSPAQTPFVNCLEQKFLGTHTIHCPFSGWAPGVLLWGEQVLELNIRRSKLGQKKNRHQGSPFFWEKKLLADLGLSWGKHFSKPHGWGKRKTPEPYSEAGGREQFAFSPRRGWADGMCYWEWLSPKKADLELTTLMICFQHVAWGMLIRISKVPASHLSLIDNFSGLPGHLFDFKYITKITTEGFFNPFLHVWGRSRNSLWTV